jgi:Carboxypeptidase regulatory-like domain
MKRIVFVLFVVFLISGLYYTDAWAQATAQVSGTVRDQSGAVLPGVEVTATQTETGVTRNAVTNETGSYILSNLALGPYRLEAALPGFRTSVQTGIVLQVNSNPVINPVLEVGQISEQVEVQGNAALVETRSQGVGSVMENQRILELPLNGRQATDLIELSGAATPSVGIQAPKNFQRNGIVSIAGGLGTGATYTLDGGFHNQFSSGGNLSTPFPDALQEFKVETSALSAQQGMHSAGAVTMVTKSGTNEWHGDLFEFVRNGKFNGRNVFATKRDTLKRSQFGGTIGAPIIKNKLFFFAGYQGTTTRQDPSDTQSFIPTAAILAGEWTAFASPACNAGVQRTLRAPYVNGGNSPNGTIYTISPTQYNRIALAIVNRADFPKTSDPCGRIIWGNPVSVNDHMAIGRIDYQWTQKHTLFGRYLLDSSRGPDPYSKTKNLLSVSGNNTNAMANAFTLGSTYLISANMVNALRLTATRTATNNESALFYSWAELGAKIFSPYPGRSLLQPISGAFGIGGGTQGGPGVGNLLGGSDDVSWARGRHQIAVGVGGGHFTNEEYNKGRDTGRVTINGSITGLGMADFMTGNVSTFDQAGTVLRDDYKWYLGSYGSDTWKATPKLTVNYGVRWEPYFPQTFKRGGSMNFNLDAFVKGEHTSVYKNAPPGLFFTGDEGGPGRGAMFTKWTNFSPRLGLAYDVRGDGSTSVRASYGLFYDFMPLAFWTSRVPAFVPAAAVQAVKLDDPWANFPGGNPFPYTIPAPGQEVRFQSRQIIASIPYHPQPPQVSQWNLSVQKQFGRDWIASASYLGSQTAHLWTVRALNPAVFLGLGTCTLNGVSYPICSTTANTDQRRVLSLLNPTAGEFYSFVNELDQGATASYNGVLLSVQRRAARGVTLNANYTWSHCIADLTNNQPNSGGADGAYLDPSNRSFDRGNCQLTGQDRRQLFNFTAVAASPTFENKTLRTLATGWRLAPLVRISSGPALTVTTGTDVALSSIAAQRPNQILGDPYLHSGGLGYLNPAAFRNPAAGSLGNVGVGSVRGPTTWQFDAALSRTFQVTETKRFEVRAEAFNITNSFRRGNPTTALNSNTFGQITTALDPRIMQFALKYVF